MMKVLLASVFLMSSSAFATAISPKAACAAKIKADLYGAFESTDIEIGEIVFQPKGAFLTTKVDVKAGGEKYVMGYTVKLNRASCDILSSGEVIEGVE